MTRLDICLTAGICIFGAAVATVISKCYFLNNQMLRYNENLEQTNAQLRANNRQQNELWKKEYQQVYANQMRAEVARDEAKIKIYDLKQRLRAQLSGDDDRQVHNSQIDPTRGAEERGLDIEISASTSNSGVNEDAVACPCPNAPMEMECSTSSNTISNTSEIEISIEEPVHRVLVESPFEPSLILMNPTDFLVSAIFLLFVCSLLIHVVIRTAKTLLCTNHFVRIN